MESCASGKTLDQPPDAKVIAVDFGAKAAPDLDVTTLSLTHAKRAA